jgi:mutator protein MutT
MKQIDVAIAVVCHQGQVLICLRKPDGHLGNYWEFPGGKIEPGESMSQCLTRELREETHVEAEILTPLPVIEHEYSDRSVRLHPYLCAYASGEPVAAGCQEVRWVPPQRLREYKFPPANDGLIELLTECLLAGVRSAQKG